MHDHGNALLYGMAITTKCISEEMGTRLEGPDTMAMEGRFREPMKKCVQESRQSDSHEMKIPLIVIWQVI